VEFPKDIIEFFTRTDSIGFPILVAVGLGIIIALINAESKVQRREHLNFQERSSEGRKGTTPFKPF